jgi:hypothetical protein
VVRREKEAKRVLREGEGSKRGQRRQGEKRVLREGECSKRGKRREEGTERGIG